MKINKLHQILGALYRDNNNELALELLKEHLNIESKEEIVHPEKKETNMIFEEMIAKGLSPEELDKELSKYLGDDLDFDEFEEVEDFDALDELTSEDYQDEEEEYQG